MGKNRKKRKAEVFAPKFKEFERRSILPDGNFNMGEIVRGLRKERHLSGVDFCKLAGMDPKTLNALEKGRIKNPSLNTLQTLAKGFGVTVSDLFRNAEMDTSSYFHLGNQKGAYYVDFPTKGAKLVSFTPLTRNFFTGKLFLEGHQKLNFSFFKHRFPIYMAVVVGRLAGVVEGREISLKEGENIFFHGSLDYSFQNPLSRDTVILLVTAPSFL